MTGVLSCLPRPIARWTRLLGVASLVGVLAGLAAAALEYGLHLGSEHLVGRFTDLGEANILSFRVWLLLLPALGGLVSGLMVHWLCPRLRGHGTDLLVRAFHRQGGVLPLRGPAVNAVAAESRRVNRFWDYGHTQGPITPNPAFDAIRAFYPGQRPPRPMAPPAEESADEYVYTLDLRRNMA